MTDPNAPTMRAAVLDRVGDETRLTTRDWPIPSPEADEVRVRVGAAALNRADLAVLAGLDGPGLRPRRLPLVPGVDLAGTIDALGADSSEAVTSETIASGADASRPARPGPDAPEAAAPRADAPGTHAPDHAWHVGDRVVAYPGVFCGRCLPCRRGEESMCDRYQIIGEERDGGFAEYVTVPVRNLKRVPDGVPFEVAAAAPATFTTAWRMLITAGGLQPGQTVLVVGVGSGVSTAAIAIARRVGARVLGTTRRPAKAERARELGVEDVHVGYDTPFDAWAMEATDGRGVDLVVDSVGAATWRQSIRSLARGGALVVCGATSGDVPEISIRELYQNHRRILGAPLGNLREFSRVMDLVFAGELAPVIDRRYPLDAVGEALARLADQDQFGKIVVLP